MSALLERLSAARQQAAKGGIPMRRTDDVLYALLAEMKAICEDVTRAGAEDELRALYWQRGLEAGSRKRYIEAGTDVHIMVARYVLDGEDNRNSTYRYALAMREAEKRQVCAADLATWLRGSGGINALYKQRETAHRAREARTLHLTSAVTCMTGVPITLTLRRRPDGFFDVLST
jgi:hypothetical protein